MRIRGALAELGTFAALAGLLGVLAVGFAWPWQSGAEAGGGLHRYYPAPDGHTYLSREENAELYVFSDLIENSGEISLFNTGNQALLARLKRDKLIPDLRGTDIRVAGIGRAGTPDRRPLNVAELNKLVAFWTAYFEAASAAEIEIGQNLVRKARSETVKAKTDRQ